MRLILIIFWGFVYFGSKIPEQHPIEFFMFSALIMIGGWILHRLAGLEATLEELKNKKNGK